VYLDSDRDDSSDRSLPLLDQEPDDDDDDGRDEEDHEDDEPVPIGRRGACGE